MPHYKSGTAAAIGDVVKGPVYSGGELIGIVVRIVPGAETCNAYITRAIYRHGDAGNRVVRTGDNQLETITLKEFDVIA